MRRTIAVFVAGVMAVAAFAAVGAQSRQAAPGEDVLPALLTEVRGLRGAIEKMAAGSARVQLALGRLQLQEQRVTVAARRLDEARSKLAAAQRKSAETQDQIASLERMAAELGAGQRRAGEDGPRPSEVAEMIKNSQREAARAATEVQQAAAEENAIANELASEQSRWMTINQRLEDLERSLDSGGK